MSGYYCEGCHRLQAKCDAIHICLCEEAGLVWEDGWVECEACARARIKEWRAKKNGLN